MPSSPHVLVTGGAGYIGSHAALALLDRGDRVTVVDSLARGHQGAIDVLARLGGDRFRFVKAELAETETIAKALAGVDAVMHFAALASVGESVEQPLLYYRNNVAGTVSLLEAMEWAGTGRLVFSSTCATYGEPPPELVPIDERCPQRPVNPYGASKLVCEGMIRDVAEARRRAGKPFAFAILRYFNVIGSDPQARLGEDHRPETQLVPICLSVAVGSRPALTIYGDDWPTPDGTCIRDYVHVEDLVDAHLLVSGRLDPEQRSGVVYNIGTGVGASVRDVVESARRVTGRPIPATMGTRRPGDPPALINSPALIQRELGWTAKHRTLDAMIATAWAWRSAHPAGYAR